MNSLEEFDLKVKKLELEKKEKEARRWQTRQRIVIAINAFLGIILLFFYTFAFTGSLEENIIKAIEPITTQLMALITAIDVAFFGLKGATDTFEKFIKKDD